MYYPSVVRRTKIVATIGPASSSPAVLRQLIASGLNVARVTLAHGTLDSQKALVHTIRREADAMGTPVGILIDLPGPKVRTTAFAGTVDLESGKAITLVSGETAPSTAARLEIDYPTLVEDLEAGDVDRHWRRSGHVPD